MVVELVELVVHLVTAGLIPFVQLMQEVLVLPRWAVGQPVVQFAFEGLQAEEEVVEVEDQDPPPRQRAHETS